MEWWSLWAIRLLFSCALSWCGLRWSILASARGFPIPFQFWNNSVCVCLLLLSCLGSLTDWNLVRRSSLFIEEGANCSLKNLGVSSFRPHILEPKRLEKYRGRWRRLCSTVLVFGGCESCWVVLWVCFAISVHGFSEAVCVLGSWIFREKWIF